MLNASFARRALGCLHGRFEMCFASNPDSAGGARGRLASRRSNPYSSRDRRSNTTLYSGALFASYTRILRAEGPRILDLEGRATAWANTKTERIRTEGPGPLCFYLSQRELRQKPNSGCWMTWLYKAVRKWSALLLVLLRRRIRLLLPGGEEGLNEAVLHALVRPDGGILDLLIGVDDGVFDLLVY